MHARTRLAGRDNAALPAANCMLAVHWTRLGLLGSFWIDAVGLTYVVGRTRGWADGRAESRSNNK